ncbi:MAG TPA: PPE family protein, partial [Mycobacterium sp.]
MDLFAPPEITSALIHSGPGAGSLIEASGAWQRLAVELENSVAGYASTLSSLIENWDGPSSMAMLQSVQPYLIWLRETAQQTSQLAAATETAATAHSAVRAGVVQPSVVTANRKRLAQLLRGNIFGTNTAAIAMTENEYLTMWA